MAGWDNQPLPNTASQRGPTTSSHLPSKLCQSINRSGWAPAANILVTFGRSSPPFRAETVMRLQEGCNLGQKMLHKETYIFAGKTIIDHVLKINNSFCITFNSLQNSPLFQFNPIQNRYTTKLSDFLLIIFFFFFFFFFSSPVTNSSYGPFGPMSNVRLCSTFLSFLLSFFSFEYIVLTQMLRWWTEINISSQEKNSNKGFPPPGEIQTAQTCTYTLDIGEFWVFSSLFW